MSAVRDSKYKLRNNFRIREDLLEIIRKGELIKLEKLIKKGEINHADLSIKDENGNTCLLLALKSDQREVFVRILQEQVDINAGDNNNVTPLHLVCCKGWLDCANLLVKKGAFVNAQDSKGNTPLHWYVQVH
jgi:ankyrin repeat protein